MTQLVSYVPSELVTTCSYNLVILYYKQDPKLYKKISVVILSENLEDNSSKILKNLFQRVLRPLQINALI